MTNTEFLRSLPQSEWPRGFTRPLTVVEAERLAAISAVKLQPGDIVHRYELYSSVHEARMLLSTCSESQSPREALEDAVFGGRP